MAKNKEVAGSTSRQKNRLFNGADEAWDSGDLRRAFTLFTKAAELGDKASQNNLGYFYDQGLFVKKDRKMAMRWYHRAYLQGDPCGASNIATVYRDLGDTRKMLWWLRRAAAMGDPGVLLDLGTRYETGLAVPRNPRKAELLYCRVLSSKYATQDDKAEANLRIAESSINRR